MHCFNDSQQPIVCFNDTREIGTDQEQRLESQATSNSSGNMKLKHLFKESQNKLQTKSKQIMKSLVTDMSTASLQASGASASLASKHAPDGVLGKIVQFM